MLSGMYLVRVIKTKKLIKTLEKGVKYIQS